MMLRAVFLLWVLVVACLARPTATKSAGAGECREADPTSSCTGSSSSSISSGSGDHTYLPHEVLRQLAEQRPAVLQVAQQCLGESEELCSLLLAVERVYNESFASSKHDTVTTALNQSIQLVKQRDPSSAQQLLQNLKRNHSQEWQASPTLAQVLVNTTQLITSYLTGNEEDAVSLLDAVIASVTKNGPDSAVPVIRRLLSTLLFTRSRLLVEINRWSEALDAATEVRINLVSALSTLVCVQW